MLLTCSELPAGSVLFLPCHGTFSLSALSAVTVIMAQGRRMMAELVTSGS